MNPEAPKSRETLRDGFEVPLRPTTTSAGSVGPLDPPNLRYTTLSDATPPEEVDLLASVYTFLISRANRKVAGLGGRSNEQGGEEDGSGIPSGSGGPTLLGRIFRERVAALVCRLRFGHRTPPSAAKVGKAVRINRRDLDEYMEEQAYANVEE
jgi:hypothetical protein